MKKVKVIIATMLALTMLMVPMTSFAADSYEADAASISQYFPSSVTVDEDIEAEDGGARARAYFGGNASVTVNGDINAENEAVRAIAQNNNSTANIIAGDVSSQNTEAVSVTVDGRNAASQVDVGNVIGINGVEATADSRGAQATVNVDGAVVVEDTGIYARANGNSASTNIDVTDGIYGPAAIDAGADNGAAANISVHDSIIASGDTAIEMNAARSSQANLNVEGIVVSAGNALDLTAGAWSPFTRDNSSINVNIDGSIMASGHGIVSSINNRNASIDVFNTEVIGTGEAAIEIDDSTNYSASNLDVTTWMILPTEDGTIAVNASDGSRNTDVEENINYIIKVEQPLEGAVLTALNAIGEALNVSHGQDVALEGEKVLLKVDLEEGYRILGVYSDLGQETEMLQDEEGNYYVIVPHGGGVYLSAEVSNEYTVTFVNDDDLVLQESDVAYGEMPEYTGDTPTKEPTAKYSYKFVGWTPEIDVVTGEIIYKAVYEESIRNYDIVFDLNGGTLDGHTGTITENYDYGTSIRLPQAPEKEGYRFLYWKGSEYAPGQSYTVEGAHTFTAVYEKIEDEKTPAVTPTNTTGKTTTATAAAAVTTSQPQTGDVNTCLPIIAAIVALLVMVYEAVSMRRNKVKVRNKR